MNLGTALRTGHVDFDAFRAAAGSSLVCGGFSVAFPSFVAPTVTLAALAFAAWVSSTRRRAGGARSGIPPGLARTLLAASPLALATGVFFFPPSPLLAFRALVLASSLLPLVALERGRRTGVSSGAGIP